MANARSRRNSSHTKGGVVMVKRKLTTKKKSKIKSLPFPFFVSLAEGSNRELYMKHYYKQRIELLKNRKFSRQHKGVQRPYKMHGIIQNLIDSAY